MRQDVASGKDCNSWIGNSILAKVQLSGRNLVMGPENGTHQPLRIGVSISTSHLMFINPTNVCARSC